MTGDLYHHGIRNQKWGVRNGPPYPLRGGDYSPAEKRAILEERKNAHSIYNKKHFDTVIKEGTTTRTLSWDKDRTKNTDMYYATYDSRDKNQYMAMFNRKTLVKDLDDDGNVVRSGRFYKYKIDNVASKDIKVASEDSGTEVFLDLYKNSRDFYNYVTDPDRMESKFVANKYKFKGYRDARSALERVRQSDKPAEQDVRTIYRTFNYVIPNNDADTVKQRAAFFNGLKSKGYGAVLDTNDAIYGGFKANAPVIVFDTKQLTAANVSRSTSLDKLAASSVLAGEKLINSLGL